jgi:prefoldin subunit 5
MSINQELKLSIIINQNKMILDKLEKIEKRLDKIEQSTNNMDEHIEEINSIYSNYKDCLDFITTKYNNLCISMKKITNPLYITNDR